MIDARLLDKTSVQCGTMRRTLYASLHVCDQDKKDRCCK